MCVFWSHMLVIKVNMLQIYHAAFSGIPNYIKLMYILESRPLKNIFRMLYV